jgi:hypothetical protein
MVTPRTENARKNLQRGIERMEQRMSAAARVRRDFKLGRPPKPVAGDVLQIHPNVVWQKATESLSKLREAMQRAKLNPDDVDGAVVYVEKSDPDKPHVLLIAEKEKTPEQSKEDAVQKLMHADVIALGMIFAQHDAELKKQAYFPLLFVGLNKRGMDVLKKVAEEQFAAHALLKNVN